ncbi:MAG: group II intron reverse transcriptase/maturase [Candidatus Edwardsbacteria bacterium]
MRKDIEETSADHRVGKQMLTKFMPTTLRRNPKYRYMSLTYMLTEEYLKECFNELKRDKAIGIDGVTMEGYEVNLEENIKDLVRRMKEWKYRPQPVRRVYIPKPNGDKRPLGIPAVEDKIVQMGIKKILEAIFETDFIDVSYGFRPNRSCHDALNAVDVTIMTKPVNYVVDMDIEKFFDTINHEWLMRCLKQRIADKTFLRLISRFLKAGVMEEGKFKETDRGTPQGGIISPILANIYLHYILDLWFEKKIKKELEGYAQIIRYCDDFVCCFQKGKSAKEFGEKLKERLNKFGLRIAEDKSRIIEFGRYALENAKRRGEKAKTFNFLGFTHYCDKTRKGKFKVGRKTSNKKFWAKMKEMNQWFKNIRNLMKLKEWWEILRMKLYGHYHYYGISGNRQSIEVFYTKTVGLTYKWINRRSQKKSFNITQFKEYMKQNPLPEPKIYHLYPELA